MGRRRSRILRLLAGVVLVATLSGCASAPAGFNEGKAAYIAGDYATALVWLFPLAEQGHADSQLFLGIMYYESRGAIQNYAEALKWYRKSAEQGVALAQLGLGIMYAGGKGVTQDYVAAHMWFSLAAELGNEELDGPLPPI